MTTVPSSPTPSTPDVRALAVEAATNWALMYPIPAWGLADVDGERAHKLAANWGRVVADAVLAAVAPEIRRQVAEAVAYDIRAEMVCCDIYDQDADTDRAGTRHAICFWGEAGARIADDHADGTPERLLLSRLHVEPSAARRSRRERGTDD